MTIYPKFLGVCVILFGLLPLLVIGGEKADKEGIGTPGLVIQLEVEGLIGPATSDYVIRSLAYAAEKKASLVILRMDTPGGLDIAMREIIKQILASPVPVATFVAPSGARAASAGTYILYASHIAAMAPATNLGAATPVTIGVPEGIGEDKQASEKGTAGAMERKMVNDAVAYIRGLAKLRGRNADWAEKAVREAASLAAEEALRLKVIDLVSPNVDDLLQKLDGREVNVLGLPVKLDLAGARVEQLKPDWRSRLLAVITNPNIAYILLLIGIYGLILEFSHPGTVVPGTVGAICLFLALYSLQMLPVNYAGLALILLGGALMTAEAFAPGFGILGIGGMSAFVIGSLILMDTDMPGYQLSLPIILAFTLVSAFFSVFVLGLIIKSRRKPVVSGREQMIGGIGCALDDFETNGRLSIHGEIWFARTDAPLRKGQQALVREMDGLTLLVTPLKKQEENDR